jgi:hypothetical protein
VFPLLSGNFGAALPAFAFSTSSFVAVPPSPDICAPPGKRVALYIRPPPGFMKVYTSPLQVQYWTFTQKAQCGVAVPFA